ncbi:MAG TPA: class IV adenylate cyclase [Candidatus Saccharimonadales bacterium]
MIEVERKFRITPEQKSKIRTDMENQNGSLQPLHQIDEVFLQGLDSFEGFKQGMPVIRLRTENGVTEMAYKRRLNEGGDMKEHELLIGSASVMRSILAEMDFRPVTVVDKIRLQAKAGEMALMLDEVKHLGDFLEIEIMATDESELDDAYQRIMQQAATYGLGEIDIESQKYDKLLAEAGH